MDENGVITNKNQDGFDGIPLYFFQVNVENQGSLPMRVTLAVREQKKGNDPDLPYGDTIPNLVDNGSGGVTVDEDEPEIACQNDLRGVLHIQLYRVAETADGYALQPIDNGARGRGHRRYRDPVEGRQAFGLCRCRKSSKQGKRISYIVAAWLPETVGNESQGQAFPCSPCMSMPARWTRVQAHGTAARLERFSL